MGSTTGAVIAQNALKYPGTDERKYGAVAPKVDCSMFVAEVYAISGYTLPRVANDQANWFKKNGSFTKVFKDLQVGDAAYWDRGGGSYHTGIIVQVTPVVKVVHATVYGNRANCIRNNGVKSNGIIEGWFFNFVGAGRAK